MDLNSFKLTLKCPITKKYFKNPVFCQGKLYEKDAIMDHYTKKITTHVNLVNRDKICLDVLIQDSIITQQQLTLFFNAYPELVSEQFIQFEPIDNDTFKTICDNLEFDKLLSYTNFNLDEPYTIDGIGYFKKTISFLEYLLKKCISTDVIIHMINQSNQLKYIDCIKNKIFINELEQIIRSNNTTVIKYVLGNYEIKYDDYYFGEHYKYKTFTDMICLHCSYDIIMYYLAKDYKLLCLPQSGCDKYTSPITFMRDNNLISSEQNLNFLKYVENLCKTDASVYYVFFRKSEVFYNIIIRSNDEVINFICSSNILDYDKDTMDPLDRTFDLKENFSALISNSAVDLLPEKIIFELLKRMNKDQIIKQTIGSCCDYGYGFGVLHRLISSRYSDILIEKILFKENASCIDHGWSVFTLLVQYRPHLIKSYLHLFDDFNIINANYATPVSLCILRNIDACLTEFVDNACFKSTSLYYIIKHTDINEFSIKAFAVLLYSLPRDRQNLPKSLVNLIKKYKLKEAFVNNPRLVCDILPPYNKWLDHNEVYEYIKIEADTRGIDYTNITDNVGATVMHYSWWFKYLCVLRDGQKYLEFLKDAIALGYSVSRKNNYGHDMLDICVMLSNHSDKRDMILVKELAKLYDPKILARRTFKWYKVFDKDDVVAYFQDMEKYYKTKYKVDNSRKAGVMVFGKKFNEYLQIHN